MRPIILSAVLMLAVAGAALAADAPVVIDNMENPALYTRAQADLNMKWTGEVSLETADCKEGEGCLRFDVHSAKTGEESYPQWGRSFDPARNDWTNARALRYWVKLTSSDPKVEFKNMCCVVYNGDSPFQQFQVHQVPVGRWVQLTDLLLNYNRDRVRGIIIYLYETDPSAQSDYTWLVDDLELLPMAANAAGMDSMGVVTQDTKPVLPLSQIQATSGLALQFDKLGRIPSVSLPGRHATTAPRSFLGLTGLTVRDWRKGEVLEPLTAPVKRDGKALTQSGSVCDGLQVSARYQPESDGIKCSVSVHDTKTEDRPLTVYFAVPIDAVGWQWWDDIQKRRTIEGSKEYLANDTSLRAPSVSNYPFCCVSNDKQSLAFATPIVPPRLNHMVYNAALRLLYIGYDFCLSPAATKQKQSNSFEFYLTAPDPQWGFRSAVDWYYRKFPDYFTKRVPHEGGWGCWGNYGANPKIADLGFAFHWGPDSRGADNMTSPMKFDNEHGYFSLPYVEFTNLHVTMEGYEKANNQDIMDRIHLIADPDRKTPLPRWGYTFPYDDRCGPDYDGFMRKVYQAYLKSLIYDSNGNLYGGADKGEFSLLVAKYIPFNADPDIPGGAGEFFLKTYWPLLDKYYADRKVRYDGFGWDNFYVKGCSLDYRREHFAYADEPLIFDARSLKPALLKDICTYKMQQVVAGKLRKDGKYLIANQGSISPVTATMPLLDVFGYEWGIANSGTYARVMGHHKPVCSLPCAPDHYKDPYVRDHLLYGAWPGGYYDTSDPGYLALLAKYLPIIRRECAAGWEPITFARTDKPDVQIERFGGGKGKALLFSLKNLGTGDQPVRITVDKSMLPNATALKATELVNGQALNCALAAGGLQVDLTAPAGAVVVVAVE